MVCPSRAPSFLLRALVAGVWVLRGSRQAPKASQDHFPLPHSFGTKAIAGLHFWSCLGDHPCPSFPLWEVILALGPVGEEAEEADPHGGRKSILEAKLCSLMSTQWSRWDQVGA